MWFDKKKSLTRFLTVVGVLGLFILLYSPGTGSADNDFDTSALMSEYPDEWGVVFQDAHALSDSYVFGRTTTTYPAGTVFPPAAMPLPCDIIHDRDVPVTLRDGTVIYTDILRPAGSPTNLPALISYSPYGKTIPTGVPTSVPPEWVSGLQKFEGADSAFWCCNGYALVNPDTRGTGMSEGNIHFWGSVEAADGYDLIEWTASQDWSNGKVGLYGTSWLSITQWFIAATQPPHLAAIAPWNGFSDMYRHHIAIGGIPDTAFARGNASHLTGKNKVESPAATMDAHPLMNDYWKDKAADLEKITVPAYVGADTTTVLHRIGALEGFRRISSANKWLRVNNTNEWYDQYKPANQQDLLKFYDTYLKGASNGWEDTPKVRTAVLDPGGIDQESVSYSQWPPAGTQYTRYYLDASAGSLSAEPATTNSSVSYDANTGEATFTIKFDQATQVVGYPKLRLYVQADGANDMDLFVLVQKLDANGNVLDPRNAVSLQYDEAPPGTRGRMRVSLRALDQTLTTDFLPVQSFLQNEYLSAGEIVPVDIAIYPEAVLWHAGQQLRVIVAGHIIQMEETTVPTNNQGTHIIHTGPDYQSYLQLPLVPVSY